MFAKTIKTLVVALVLAGTSLALTGNAGAGFKPGSQAEQNWFDRASAPDTERNAFGY
jgi:hypothetical protein